MAKSWEFDCPQFYDFCNGVEDSTVNIHHLGGDSPNLENKFNLKLKNVMKNRFAAQNDKLSTPLNKSPFVNVNRQINETDSDKLNGKKKRLSKSEGSVNLVGKYDFSKMNSRRYGLAGKKSLSDSDVRPRKKFPVTPRRIPATPMCLKRTLKKDKAKKLKSTEELELEKIAELQRMTFKHLRLNERNLEKMKLIPKPSTVPKQAFHKSVKTEKSATVKKFQKDLEEVVKTVNRNKRFLAPNLPKHRERLGAVSSVSNLNLGSSPRTLQQTIFEQSKEVQNALDEKDIIHELSFKKPTGHSGLIFHQNNSKKSALKPINFHDRPGVLSKSTVQANKENVQVTKPQLSHSFHASRIKNQNKENLSMKVPKTDAGIRPKSFKF